MEITYDYYRIFYYVAKYKSFSRASEALTRNQPNITRAVKNLEAQLGCKLFVRSNRGVSLTPEGEMLYRHVSIAYFQLQKAEQELAENRRLHGGIVRIGASETALHGMLLPVLKAFHAAYPEVRLQISNDSTPQALQALRDGVVDFAVVTTPMDIRPSFQCTSLVRFQEWLLASQPYAHLARQPQALSDLMEYPWIGLGRSTKTYEFYMGFFLDQHLVLKLDTEVATADQLLPMIQNNLGIGFVPEALARDALTSGDLVRISLAGSQPEREIILVEDTSTRLSIAAKAFRQLLLQHASEKPAFS